MPNGIEKASLPTEISVEITDPDIVRQIVAVQRIQEINTNSVLGIVLGDEEIRNSLERASPGFTGQISELVLKRAEIENESMVKRNEALLADSKMSRRGQNFAATVLGAGYLVLAWFIYLGAYTQAAFLGGCLLATPLVNNFIASKWGNKVIQVNKDKE